MAADHMRAERSRAAHASPDAYPAVLAGGLPGTTLAPGPAAHHRSALISAAAAAVLHRFDLTAWEAFANVPVGAAQWLIDHDRTFGPDCEKARMQADIDGTLLRPAAVRLATSAVELMQRHIDSDDADLDDAVNSHKAAMRAIEHADRVMLARRDPHADLPMVTFIFGPPAEPQAASGSRHDGDIVDITPAQPGAASAVQTPVMTPKLFGDIVEVLTVRKPDGGQS